MTASNDGQASRFNAPDNNAVVAASSATNPPGEKNGEARVDDDIDEYAAASALSCPPLFQLQLRGLCCPFLETEEEHDARVGYANLRNYPITWYRKKLVRDVAEDVRSAVSPSNSGMSGAAGGLVDGIAGGIGQLLGKNGKNTEIPMTRVGVPATLTVVDTKEHGPVLQIRALEATNDDGDDDPARNAAARSAINEYVTSGKPWWEDPSLAERAPSKVLPLYMVDKVAAAGWGITGDASAGGVKLYAAPPSKGLLSGFGPELLRFDTLGGEGNAYFGGSTVSPGEPNKYSDRVIVQLKSLVDWNRRRMAKDIKHGRMVVAPKSISPGYVAMA